MEKIIHYLLEELQAEEMKQQTTEDSRRARV